MTTPVKGRLGEATQEPEESQTVPEVSSFRLYLLRATYLFIVVGLGSVIWPGLIHHTPAWALRYGDSSSLLAAVSVLAVVGIRYPLKMLPLLLFELTWKLIWLTAIAAPLWRANQMGPGTWESIIACGMGLVIFPLVIPWPYVFAQFVKEPGDRWKWAEPGQSATTRQTSEYARN